MWRSEEGFKALLVAGEKKLSKSVLDKLVDIAVKEAKEGYKSVCGLLERQMKSSKPKSLLNLLYVMSAICRKSKRKYAAKDQYGKRFEPRLEAIAGYISKVPAEDRGGVAKVVQIWKQEAIFSQEALLWFQGFSPRPNAASSEQLSLATPVAPLTVEPAAPAPPVEHDFGDEFSEPSAGSVDELPPPPVLASATGTATRLTPGAATLSTGSTKQAEARPTYKYVHAASSGSSPTTSPTSADPPPSHSQPLPSPPPSRKRSRWDTPRAAAPELPDMQLDPPAQQPAAPAEPLAPPPPQPLPTPAAPNSGPPSWQAAPVPPPPQQPPAMQGWGSQAHAYPAQPPQGAYSQPQGAYSQVQGYMPQWPAYPGFPPHQNGQWPPAPMPAAYGAPMPRSARPPTQPAPMRPRQAHTAPFRKPYPAGLPPSSQPPPPPRPAAQTGADILADAIALARSAAREFEPPAAPPAAKALDPGTLQAPVMAGLPAQSDVPEKMDVAAELREVLEDAALGMRAGLKDSALWPPRPEDASLPPPPPRGAPPLGLKVNLVAEPQPAVARPAAGVAEAAIVQEAGEQVATEVKRVSEPAAVAEQGQPPVAADSQADMTGTSAENGDAAGAAQVASDTGIASLRKQEGAGEKGAGQEDVPVATSTDLLAAGAGSREGPIRYAALQHQPANCSPGAVTEPDAQAEPASNKAKHADVDGTALGEAMRREEAAAVTGLHEEALSIAECNPPPLPERVDAAAPAGAAQGRASDLSKEPGSPTGPRIGSPDWSSLGSLMGPNDKALLDTPLSRLQQPALPLSMLLPGDGTAE